MCLFHTGKFRTVTAVIWASVRESVICSSEWTLSCLCTPASERLSSFVAPEVDLLGLLNCVQTPVETHSSQNPIYPWVGLPSQSGYNRKGEDVSAKFSINIWFEVIMCIKLSEMQSVVWFFCVHAIRAKLVAQGKPYLWALNDTYSWSL